MSILAMALLVGCAPKPDFTPAQWLAGDWTSTMDGSRVQLMPDGRMEFHFVDEDGPGIRPGVFDATWNTITFNTDVGPCANVQGRYRYEMDMGTLLFTLVKDDCPRREKLLELSWTRMQRPDIPRVEAGEVEAAEADR